MHRELLAMGIESEVCSTYGGTPQHCADRTHEFRRIWPQVAFYAPALSRHGRELVANSDIVHGHGFYVGTNYLLGREARHQRKSLVYHVHGIFEPYILRRSRWKKKLAHWLFEDANFLHAKLWRALTAREADQIRACGIKAPIVVAPNGLNLEDYPVAEAKDAMIETPLIPVLTKTRNRVLFLGRIHPKKGLDILLPAWAALGKIRTGWELVIAGPDEQGYLSEVRVMAAALEIQPEIRFTGPVVGRSKRALLQSADIFVLPSHSEGFPMSLLEAMASEAPIVATRACNLPELTAAEAGWECDCTAKSVEETLRQAMLEGEAARRQRGRNGRRLVRDRFAWPVILPTLLQACAEYCETL
jgi:glycosyltransferase involved in cell wall biosynthesis